MINDYNYDLVKKEFPSLYESVEFNTAKILKKYNTKIYRYFTSFLASNKTNIYYKDKIDKYLFSLYLDSLTKYDLKELKFFNKQISKLVKNLEFEFLATFTEIDVLDIPPMQKNTGIVVNAKKIMLRDKDGFYSNDNNTQNKVNEQQAVFKTLHSYLLNKENIMNGKREINSTILTRKEVLVIANYLGYSSVREEILESQTREKEKYLTKTKKL